MIEAPTDGWKFSSLDRELVVVQGLGAVGSAMAVAIAAARDRDGEPVFNVAGLDLPTEFGKSRCQALNSGIFPFENSDAHLAEALVESQRQGNLWAGWDAHIIKSAAVVVVDVNLDVVSTPEGPCDVDWEAFRTPIETIGHHVQPGALVVVETTVPPGTCAKFLSPIIAKALDDRGLDSESVHIAHSYERVTPGANYLDSIIDFPRVYAADRDSAAEACEAFLSRVVNDGPNALTRLSCTNASETAKVLENSYRAVNIAFMREWGQFAEESGLDMFEIIDAIRVRPTHSNIMQPGIGVGGYCLPKDPLMAGIAARQFYSEEATGKFPFSEQAVAVNASMPLDAVSRLESELGGLAERRIALLGVTYRPGVADTRYSPSETFAREVEVRGGSIFAHDPLVSRWEEFGRDLPGELPSAKNLDAVVFAVAHDDYRNLDMRRWPGSENKEVLIMDANAVLSPDQLSALTAMGCRVVSIGKGRLA